MVSPSKVVNVTGSPVDKNKKENPKKWKSAAVYKCLCKDEGSKEYPIMRADGTCPLQEEHFM